MSAASLLLFLLAAGGVASAPVSPYPLPNGIRRNAPPGAHHVVSPMPHEYLKPEDVPASFSVCNVNGSNYCTEDRNQHTPVYCAGCWAVASVSALSDRVKLARNGTGPEIVLATQTLLDCVPFGCSGGDPDFAYLFIREHGVGPESCHPYQGIGSGQHCSEESFCTNCIPNGTCVAVTQFPSFSIAENGAVLGEAQMKAEVFARGSIACGIDAQPIYFWGFGGNRRQVFTSNISSVTVTHVVVVVGWGYDPVQKLDYWLIRNSWGAYWGNLGYFRLERGKNRLLLESTPCSWATPVLPPDLYMPFP